MSPDVINDDDSKVILVHAMKSVYDSLIKSLGFQYFEHPGEDHEIKGGHVVIIQNTSPLILTIGRKYGIPGPINSMVYPHITFH